MFRKLIIAVGMLAISTIVHAQFFDFGFGEDFFGPRREQSRREAYTAPQYKGGDEAVKAFLLKNFKNPETQHRDLEGVVVVACIINEKGRVTETHIVRGLGRDYDQEAQRVCSRMKFKPALLGKKKTRGRYDVTFPIRRGRLSFSRLETVDV